MTLYEHYNAGNDSEYDNSEDDIAQTFTVGTVGSNEEFELDSIKLRLRQFASSGNITISIFATSGGAPTGSAISTGTIDASTITTSAGGDWYEASMSSATLSASTTYAIAVMNATANVKWQRDASSPTYAGGSMYTGFGGSWFAASGSDFMFEVYGSVPSVDVTVTPNTLSLATEIQTITITGSCLVTPLYGALALVLYSPTIVGVVEPTTYASSIACDYVASSSVSCVSPYIATSSVSKYAATIASSVPYSVSSTAIRYIVSIG